jgi:hypothetical protein
MISSFDPKKPKTAGTTKILSRIARSHTIWSIDLVDHESLAKKHEIRTIKIKKPTGKDYKNVPKYYVPSRPLLTWDVLKKVPAGIKRLHDWYIRAFAVGINTINVCIPVDAFAIGNEHAIVMFEDMWLMMNLKRLDVQLVMLLVL